jgi:hypothetical protein
LPKPNEVVDALRGETLSGTNALELRDAHGGFFA